MRKDIPSLMVCVDIPMLGQHTDVTEFNGHKESVNDIKWSSHPDKALFASASDDNYICVWNAAAAAAAKPIAKFKQHRSRVFAVEWNHITLDSLFSGGQDKFIYEWDFNDYPYDERKDAEPTKYHRERFALVKNKKKRKEAPNKSLSSSTADTATVSPAKKKAKADTHLPESSMLHVAQASESSTSRLKREQYCLIVANNMLGGKVKEAAIKIKKSLTQEQLQDAAVQKYLCVWDADSTQKETHYNIHELLYGDKNDIRRLLELEGRLLVMAVLCGM